MNVYRLFIPLPATSDQIRESLLVDSAIVQLIYQHVPTAMVGRRERGRQPYVVVELIADTDTALRALVRAYRAAFRGDTIALVTTACTVEMTQ